MFCSLMAVACLNLVGCSNQVPDEVKVPQRLEIQITTDSKVNTDDKNRPSPVLVRVYALSSDAAFSSADFFSLQNNDTATLGNDLITRDEFILRPGDVQNIRRKMDPKTRNIGILVGFRDLAKSKWREVYKLEEAPDVAWYQRIMPVLKVRLDINIELNTITVSEPE